MIKLVALDLDGTLLSSFGVLSADAADTLRQLRKKGILVVISSGRPYYSVQHIIPDDCYDYASCMNGQDIYCVKRGKHQQKPNLTEEEKQHLIGYLKDYRMLMECAIDGQGYYIASTKHQAFVNFFQSMNSWEGVSIRFGYVNANWIGSLISGFPICAIIDPSIYSTIE